MKYRIDHGAANTVALGLCLEDGCGNARYLGTTKLAAMEALARHEERAHPGGAHVRNALGIARKRAGKAPVSGN